MKRMPQTEFFLLLMLSYDSQPSENPVHNQANIHVSLVNGIMYHTFNNVLLLF